MASLAKEWGRCRDALTDRHIDRLAGLGILPEISRRAVGVAYVERFGSGWWQPLEEGGTPCFVSPAGWWCATMGEWRWIADLVAWGPNSPEHWALRTGEGLILGAEVADEAARQRRPLELDETPLSWLRRACTGACILDWHRVHPVLDFSAQVELRCATPELRRRLQRRMAELAAPAFTVTTTAVRRPDEAA